MKKAINISIPKWIFFGLVQGLLLACLLSFLIHFFDDDWGAGPHADYYVFTDGSNPYLGAKGLSFPMTVFAGDVYLKKCQLNGDHLFNVPEKNLTIGKVWERDVWTIVKYSFKASFISHIKFILLFSLLYLSIIALFRKYKFKISLK